LSISIKTQRDGGLRNVGSYIKNSVYWEAMGIIRLQKSTAFQILLYTVIYFQCSYYSHNWNCWFHASHKLCNYWGVLVPLEADEANIYCGWKSYDKDSNFALGIPISVEKSLYVTKYLP